MSPDKIDLIPHGVPDVQFIDPTFHKDQFGVEGKTVLLTFGLLSPNKGIEYVIEALPAILQRHPNVVYIVLGATHPNLLVREGESYRLKLERLAEDRGVTGNVIFYNRFVTLEELTEFIGAADIYVTPYLNEAQITSGTLAYAFGAGKAVISTPYLYAQELLAEERGVLVPFRDSAAIAGRSNSTSIRSRADDRDAEAGLESRARNDLAGGSCVVTWRVSREPGSALHRAIAQGLCRSHAGKSPLRTAAAESSITFSG